MHRHLHPALNTHTGLPDVGSVVDPLVIDRQVDKFRKGKRTLTAAAAHYGVRQDGAHAADEDCLTAARVLWRICQRYPRIAEMNLQVLHDAQVDWYRSQAEGLAAHFRGTGNVTAAEGVSTSWPFSPVA
jgi:DNA polymerase-3 subunit epsilon